MFATKVTCLLAVVLTFHYGAKRVGAQSPVSEKQRTVIVLGFYSDEHRAHAAQSDFVALGLSPILTLPAGSGVRVVMDGFESRSQAETWRDKLITSGVAKDAWLLDVDSSLTPASALSSGRAEPANLIAGPSGSLPIIQEAVFDCYSIQVGAYPTRNEAAKFRLEFIAQGFAPIHAEEGPGEFTKLSLGEFRLYADALLYRTRLRQSGISPDAFVVSRPCGMGASDTMTGPVPERLAFTAKPAYAHGLHEILSAQADETPVTESLEEALLSKGLMQPLSFQTESGYSPSPRALVHLSRSKSLSAQGNTVDATREALNAAFAFHRSTDRAAAYEVLVDLERTGGDAQYLSYLAVQKAGLLVELAQSGKGSLGEARYYIVARLRTLAFEGAAGLRHKALLELMYGESFVKEGKIAEGLSSLEAFEARWSGIPYARRELGACRVWLGVGRLRQGDKAGARVAFESVVSMELSRQESFAAAPPEATAARWLMDLGAIENDPEARDIWRDFLTTIHPDTREAISANREAIRERNAGPKK